MRISTRYLQRLLKTSGTSFTAHVTELRLLFATSHCGLVFLIFRTSIDFSVPALVVRQRAFVRTNKQRTTLTTEVPCSEPRGGDATAVQSRRRASKSETWQDGSAQEPHCIKGYASSQFICCWRGNEGRTAHSRAR